MYVFKHNPSLKQFNGISTGCYYVSQTYLDVLERLDNHMNEARKDSSKWGEDYFLERNNEREFHVVHEKSMELVQRFSRETKTSVNRLLYSESIVVEASLAKWLKNKGFSVISLKI